MTGIITASLKAQKTGVLCSEFDGLVPWSFAYGTDADHVVCTVQVLQQLAGLAQGLSRYRCGHSG
jgi:hypothetical protein